MPGRRPPADHPLRLGAGTGRGAVPKPERRVEVPAIWWIPNRKFGHDEVRHGATTGNADRAVL